MTLQLQPPGDTRPGGTLRAPAGGTGTDARHQPPEGGRQDPPREGLPSLDPDQRAVLATDARVVQVAGGPGSGRTTTALALVAKPLADGVPADQVALLAADREAASRLGGRLSVLLPGVPTAGVARTAASLAFAVLRRAHAATDRPAPRLLSGAEQDLVLAELLRGHAESGGGPRWPDGLAEALGTRGFRDQLRDLLMRAVEHGVEPERLAALGHRHDRPEWAAAAQVLREYDQVTALARPGTYDPAWICAAAAEVLEDEAGRHRLGAPGVGLVVVDDAHELTASAGRLVAALARAGARVVLLGNADQTVHGFRGADPGRFPRLADRLAAPGEPSRLRLGHSHRLRGALAQAAARVVDRVGAAPGSARTPAPDGHAPTPGAPGEDGAPAPGCQAVLLRTPAQEAAYVADRLRRGHLLEGVPWSRMAVVARSRARHDSLRRALTAAGVPVVVPGSGLTLAQEPAVRMLLLAYQVVLRAHAATARVTEVGNAADAAALDEDAEAVDEGAAALDTRSLLSAAEAVDLVSSPLGGADPLALLRLRRAARRVAAELPGLEARPADEVVAALLLDPASPLVDDPDLAPVRRVANVLRAGLDHVGGHGREPAPDAETLLWTLWDRSGLSRAWEEQALAGGPAGERADRDLDAVMVLFGAAADYVERLPGMGPAGFASHVAALDLGADSLVARGHRADAVAVLTPQAAAGREWDRVAVVGVQEGVWPDLRLRDSLLGAEALVAVLHGRSVSGTEGLRAAQEQVRADELRQFYTAVTRARERLLVTAVASPDEQPSVLLDLVDPREEDRPLAEVPPPLTLRGLVATLRRELVRAHREGDRPAREEAARVLRRLVAAGVPGADPRHWWQVRDVSDPRPVQPTGTVPVSPSRVQGFSECGLRWMLTSHGGERPRQHAAAVGTLVHDIVAEQPRAGLAELQAELERRWHRLGLGDGWVARRERDRAVDMLRRYVAYADSAEAHGWRLVGTELPVDAIVDRARVTGRVDRLERHDDGRLRVVDLKTGASKPASKELARHPQLGTYQVALAEGGVRLEEAGEQPATAGEPVPRVTGAPASDVAGEPGGAVLVQLGRAAGRGPTVQPQPPLDQDEDPRWAHDLVTATAEGMGAARFPATSGSWCRTCPVTASCPLQAEGREWR